MSGEQWGEAVDAWIDAAAEPIWDYSNPEYPIRDGDAWQECRDLARQALEAAAPLIVADTRRKVAEEIAALRVEVPEDDESWDKWLASGGWNAAIGKTEAIARGSGNGDSGQETCASGTESHAAGLAPTPESQRTSGGPEMPTEPRMTYTVSGSLSFAWMTDEQIAAMSEDVGEMSAKVAAIIREAGANFAKARAEEIAP